MPAPIFRTRIALAAILVALLGSGCSSVPMGQPQASIENIQALKTAGIIPVRVAPFALVSDKDPAIDLSVGIRAATLAAPQGSFARYLQETLETELRAAALLDAGGGAEIEGLLVDRQVDSAIGEGRASLTARFIVRRRGQLAYAKEIKVASTWESSFVGAVAIPAAINEFTALFRKMVGQLLVDPEFRIALAR